MNSVIHVTPWTTNPRVVGSNPTGRTNNRKGFSVLAETLLSFCDKFVTNL